MPEQLCSSAGKRIAFLNLKLVDASASLREPRSEFARAGPLEDFLAVCG